MILLQKLRKQKGLSQKQVSKILNITQQTYSRYERGITQADYNMLCKIADLFNVSIDYLLGRESDPLFVSSVYQKSDIQKIYDALSDPNKAQLIGFGKGLLMNERKDLEKILGKRGS